MKKLFFQPLSVAVIGFLLLTSCAKENVNNSSNSLPNVAPKNVARWLEKSIQGLSPGKLKNVESLRQELLYNLGKRVSLANNRNLLVVPISETYLRKHNIHSYSKAYFIAFEGLADSIERANLVLYSPLESNVSVEVDDVAKAFQEYFTSKKVSADGKFRFMEIDGSYKYELTYLNGMPKRWDHKRSKVPQHGGDVTMGPDYACWEFYLVTTYYENGVVVGETETYLGTACYGDPNDCPGEWESICESGNGGGGSGEGGFGDVCCIPDPEMAGTSSSASAINSQSCSATYWDQTAGEYLGNCTINWEYRRESLWVFDWQWVSNESYTRKGTTINGPYIFKNISHLSNNSTGQIAPCTTVANTITNWTYALTQSNSKANINLSFTSSLDIDCCLSCNPRTQNGSATLNLVSP